MNNIQISIARDIKKGKIKCVNDFIKLKYFEYKTLSIKSIENHGEQEIVTFENREEYHNIKFNAEQFRNIIEILNNNFIRLEPAELDYNIKFVENFNHNEYCKEINEIFEKYNKQKILVFDKAGLCRFIRHKCLPDKEFYAIKYHKSHYIVAYVAIIVPIATFVVTFLLSFIFSPKPQPIYLSKPISNIDTLKISIVSTNQDSIYVNMDWDKAKIISILPNQIEYKQLPKNQKTILENQNNHQ